MTRLGGHFWQKYLEVLPKSSKTSGSILRRNFEGEGSSSSDVSNLCSGAVSWIESIDGLSEGSDSISEGSPLDASRAMWELARGYERKRFCPRFCRGLSYFRLG